MNKHILHESTGEDGPSINPYLRRLPLKKRDMIRDIRLVWNGKGERMANEWEAMAISFDNDAIEGQSDLIGFVTFLKPDEYWGFQDGYHIFWWD